MLVHSLGRQLRDQPSELLQRSEKGLVQQRTVHNSDTMLRAALADRKAWCAQVHTLRVEVQRLQVKIQEAEARASASQRIAEEAQRELQALVAASNSPVAGQARQAIDAEKAILRQQLMVGNIIYFETMLALCSS